ncbi:MAG: DUF4954 family protein [Chitinophagaceae bacterium]|nr:DUF4954 family protein [Chitinophagaceae bacterium]MBP6589506.1 DUF4954 family protein [Chitinophagaceae bacterium]MBP8243086.1 DUF4954 family protein [Chitinophagaceae bacterium]
MNIIRKEPLNSLGYGFIEKQYIPKGKDEYYLRNRQNRNDTIYRALSRTAIRILEKNGNSSDNWNMVMVAEAFDPSLVKNCKFYGLVRIGKLEPYFHEFNNLRLPVGLYNSTIISSDIGDNAVIDNVGFMSHYITGNDVMLVNINELATTDHAKFGNGVLKQGEQENIRIWLEICNENAGRSILPYNGMQVADAYLWSKHRDDEKLLQRFREFTDAKYDTRRGYYGKIGDRTVIKNCRIIKDTWIGTDAYLKGANKIKNITINSSPAAKTQIGEGCELVNGIIGFGCRIFYGVKAVRFVMGSNSQLKYGARLINSFLGDNSTISCCEVLNSLIFPAHEQHHNNSFLCAATVFGQSNMAAGATIGSNHNSRGADGELIAGRGFWPGLCVSLKHNSKFASFTLIAKGDFPAELNIPIPFSLLSNDVSNERLLLMPAYWFMYNMYALARNVTKYTSRDKRTDQRIRIEYDYLAPDSVNEIFDGLQLLRQFTGAAWARKNNQVLNEKACIQKGKELLDTKPNEAATLEILANGFENSRRKVVILKAADASTIFQELIVYYGVLEIIRLIERKKLTSWTALQKALPASPARSKWINCGGLLMKESAVQTLLSNIRSGKCSNWDEVHEYYFRKSHGYETDKCSHALASLLEILSLSPSRFTKKTFLQLLPKVLRTREWITEGISESRARDYQSPFRKMVYDTREEMEKVMGKLSDNSFIREQQKELLAFREKINNLQTQFS